MTLATSKSAPADQGPAPGKFQAYWRSLKAFWRSLNFQKVYGALALVEVPVLAFTVLFFTRFGPFSKGLIGDVQMYAVAVPVLAAAAMSMVFGVLALVVRAPWTVQGCALAKITAAALYVAATYLVDGALPMDSVSIGYLVVAALTLSPYSLAMARSQLAKPMTHDLTIAKAGNVSYTQVGLLMLFGWALWFDFCFSIMEGVLGNILQLRLITDLHTPNTWMGMVGSVSTMLGFVLTPWISITSDRHRGRRGRRIPFLMYASPFVCALLALMGFGNDIGMWLHAAVIPRVATWLPAWLGGSSLASVSQNTIIIWTFFILNFAFFIANSFMGTIIYYFFNDIVPQQHFVKFMAYMRVVGTIAGMVYNVYIFEYSSKWGPLDINLGFWTYSAENVWYPKIILVGAAIFYMLLGMITFLKMHEPTYPPPPPLPADHSFFARTGKTLKVLVTECFSHRFYAIVFLMMTLEGLGYLMGGWKLPMRVSLGMDLATLGKLGAWSSAITLILTILTANYGDRCRPLPLMAVTAVFIVLTSPIGLLYMIPGLPPSWYLGIEIVYILTHIPIGIIAGIASAPLLMELFPKERFGQFSAAGSIIRNVLCGILGMAFIGWLMDKLKEWLGGGEEYLRLTYTWQIPFQILWMLCIYMLYREWKRLGGKKSFTPPPVRPDEAELPKA